MHVWGRFGYVLALGAGLSLPLGCIASEGSQKTSPTNSATILPLSRSANGSLLVYGTNDLARLSWLRWAQAVCDRVEDILDVPAPSGRWTLRIVLQETPDPAIPRAFVKEDLTRETLVHRLYLVNPRKVDPDQCRELLCRAMLRACAYARQNTATAAGAAGNGLQVLAPVPYWFSQGLAQYLDQSLRGPNSREVLQLWESGRLAPMSQLLDSGISADGSGKGDGAAGTAGMVPGGVVGLKGRLPPAVCGLLAGWVLSMPKRADLVEQLLVRLASGEPINAVWLASILPGCSSASDVDLQWDRWLLRQRTMVYDPGRATPDIVERFRRQLLLCPGDFGIPQDKRLERRIGFRDLIPDRGQRWVETFARNRANSLQTLAAGRGERMQAAVDAYCRFLTALAEGRRVSVLEQLLNDAERLAAGLDSDRADAKAASGKMTD